MNTIKKGKGVSMHVMKAHRGKRGIAPLILNLGIRWKLSGRITHVIKKLLMELEYRKDYYVVPMLSKRMEQRHHEGHCN